MAQRLISLQKPVGYGKDSSFGDFMQDESAENPCDMTAFSLMHQELGSVF
jgi:RNA polymerase primary sigma factor